MFPVNSSGKDASSDESIASVSQTSQEDEPTPGLLKFKANREELTGRVYMSVKALHKNISGKVVIPAVHGDAPVEVIEDEGFYGCTRMTALVIPNSVKHIGMCAFQYCFELRDIVVPDSIETVGNGAFWGCSLNVTEDGPLHYIGNADNPYSFLVEGDRYALKSWPDVVIHDGCRIINAETFQFEDNIVTVHVPDSVIFIGNDAFDGCSSLEAITGLAGVKNIDEGVFRDLPLLREINLPSIETIGLMTFYGCPALEHVYLGDTIKNVVTCNFENCPSLRFNEYGGAYYLGNDANPYVYLIKAANTDIESLRINDGCKAIGTYAFSGCAKLHTVQMPDSVRSILEGAFSGCNALNQINVPSSLTLLADYAFSGCRVHEITLPEGLAVISEGAFAGCYGLTAIHLPRSLRKIGAGAFSGDNNLELSALPAGLSYIEAAAFSGCEKITSIALPSSLSLLGDRAFQNCSLTSVEIPYGVYKIGLNPFYDCSITELKLSHPDGPFYQSPLGSNVIIEKENNFVACGCMASEIPEGTLGIADGAFEGCYGLTSLDLPDSILTIGEAAFSYSGLAEIHLPAGLTSIGQYAFDSTYLTFIDIPDGVTQIEEGTFRWCNRMESIVIPEGVLGIWYYAFENCTALGKIFYKGTAEQWEKVYVSHPSDISGAAVYFYSESEPSESGHYWHYDAGLPAIWA